MAKTLQKLAFHATAAFAMAKRTQIWDQMKPGPAETVVCSRIGHAQGARCAGRQSRSATLSTNVRDAKEHFGERARPGCSFPRLAENTGRNENVQAFRNMSRATAEREARPDLGLA